MGGISSPKQIKTTAKITQIYSATEIKDKWKKPKKTKNEFSHMSQNEFSHNINSV